MPGLVGMVNLAAARTVAQVRPLLVAELTPIALPARYVFVLENGLEINGRQEEAWPAEALRAGGVCLRATHEDRGAEAAPARRS